MRSGQEGLNILQEAPSTRGIGCYPYRQCIGSVVVHSLLNVASFVCVCVCGGGGGGVGVFGPCFVV